MPETRSRRIPDVPVRFSTARGICAGTWASGGMEKWSDSFANTRAACRRQTDAEEGPGRADRYRLAAGPVSASTSRRVLGRSTTLVRTRESRSRRRYDHASDAGLLHQDRGARKPRLIPSRSQLQRRQGQRPTPPRPDQGWQGETWKRTLWRKTRSAMHPHDTVLLLCICAPSSCHQGRGDFRRCLPVAGAPSAAWLRSVSSL